MHLVLQALFCRALSWLSCLSSGETWLNAFKQVRQMHLDVLWEPHSLFFCFDTAPDLL